MKRVIPVVMICDDNFAMQTAVALTSMYVNKSKETEYCVHVIMSECSDESKAMVKAAEKPDFSVTIIEATSDKFANVKQKAHVSKSALHKFFICEMLPQYDKILYLDGDIIVREDLWELYNTDISNAFFAAINHSLGIITGERKHNGGVLLLNVIKMRENGMAQIMIKKREELGERKSMDQETFHMLLRDQKLALLPKYNVMLDKIDYEKKYYPLADYNKFYGTSYHSRAEIIKTAGIVHFTGALKPWKYTFPKCADEWYGYYKICFGEKSKLKRKGRLDYLKECYKKNGMRGLYWLLKDIVLEFLGERFSYFPDKTHGEWN